jgi:hypothetical protein
MEMPRVLQNNMIRIFLAISLLILFLSADAQQLSPFDSLVLRLESKTGYKFYYDRKQTRDVVVPLESADMGTDSLLAIILRKSGLVHTIDRYGRVFIATPPLYTAPAKGFFGVEQQAKPQVLDTSYVAVPEPVSDAGIENRVIRIGSGASGTSFTITGYIRDTRNGEPLIAASVMIEDTRTGVATDVYGSYSITVPKGRHIMKINSLGMRETRRQIDVQGPGRLDVEMKEDVTSLKAAVIVANKQSNVRGMQMGVERLTIRTLRQIPAVMGEVDIMRSLLTLPGVTSVGEGTAGYNVRGGAADQNLILLNDMTLYNPTHLFGFFSAVDPEVVRGLELYKSGIPARFGGRISSVMDVSTRDGNSKNFTGSAAIGPVTSKLTLEGPLSKKTTFLFGGRTTYSDWILKQICSSPIPFRRRTGFMLLYIPVMIGSGWTVTPRSGIITEMAA